MTKMNNKVQLIGRVGADPEVITFEDSNKMVKFSIATDDSYKDKDGNKVERTDWHNVVAYRNSADIISVHVKKGDKIGVEGSLKTRSYDDKEGNKRYATEVIADQVLFLSDKKENTPGTES